MTPPPITLPIDDPADGETDTDLDTSEDADMSVTTTPAFGCVNNTIRLRSGKYLDLADPKPDQFEFSDIAGALSKICRFGGQTPHFYSVAEHCYWCAILARNDNHGRDVQWTALLHDAAEAFIGDCVKPLKVMLPDYKIVEQRIEAVITEKFDLHDKSVCGIVSEIDHAMLIAERRALFAGDGVTWTGENDVRQINVAFGWWEPKVAEQFFTLMAADLGFVEP